MTTAAQRQREYRRRLKAGRVVLPLPVDEVALTEKLIAARRLPPGTDDRQALIEAAARLLDDLEIEA